MKVIILLVTSVIMTVILIVVVRVCSRKNEHYGDEMSVKTYLSNRDILFERLKQIEQDFCLFENRHDELTDTGSGHTNLLYKNEYFDYSQSNHAILENISYLKTLLRAHNIEYWINFGTLLGAYRNNRIIPYDGDADLGLSPSSTLKLMEAMTTIGKTYNKKYKFIFRTGKDSEIISAQFVDTENGIYTDFFVYYLNGKTLSGGESDHPYNDVYPLKEIHIENEIYPAPNRIREYLVKIYKDLSPDNKKGYTSEELDTMNM